MGRQGVRGIEEREGGRDVLGESEGEQERRGEGGGKTREREREGGIES